MKKRIKTICQCGETLRTEEDFKEHKSMGHYIDNFYNVKHNPQTGKFIDRKNTVGDKYREDIEHDGGRMRY